MRLREPCELRRDEIKSEWTQRKTTSGQNFFLFVKKIFSFCQHIFDLRARALRSLKSGNLLIFGFILVSYYLTNSLKINQISFKK